MTLAPAGRTEQQDVSALGQPLVAGCQRHHLGLPAREDGVKKAYRGA